MSLRVEAGVGWQMSDTEAVAKRPSAAQATLCWAGGEKTAATPPLLVIDPPIVRCLRRCLL